MSPIIESLPVVVLYPHSRCNCRCLMCDIWKETGTRELTQPELQGYLADFQQLSVKWVVFSGGEPLMHSDLFRFSALLRLQNIRTTILSTGLLFERHAASIASCADDAIVSLDGPAPIHDEIRRVPGAFTQLRRGIAAIHRIRADFPISARCTVQRRNFRHLRETASAARRLGLRGISFLAADLTSQAFNRPDGWPPARQAEIAVPERDLPELQAQLESLVRDYDADPFLLDRPAHLRRIALHFRAYHGTCEPEAPCCNAPWVSAVIEADGAVRPCFFHAPVGRVNGQGLAAVLNGPAALRFRSQLDVRADPICKRCVCSLNWNGT